MKKFVSFLTLLLACCGCTVIQWRGVGRAASAGATAGISGRVRPGPFWRQNGIYLSPRSVAAKNATGMYLKIVVYDREVARMGPWDMVYDEKYWEPLDPRVPMMAVGYADPEFTECLDASGFIFNLYRGNASAQAWTIKPGDFADRGRLYQPHPLIADIGAPTPQRVDFPREPWRSAVGVQIANMKSVTADFYVNDAYRVISLGPCEVGYVVVRKFVSEFYGQSFTLQAIYTDEGDLRVGGSRTFHFFLPVNTGEVGGPYAHQIVLTDRGEYGR